MASLPIPPGPINRANKPKPLNLFTEDSRPKQYPAGKPDSSIPQPLFTPLIGSPPLPPSLALQSTEILEEGQSLFTPVIESPPPLDLQATPRQLERTLTPTASEAEVVDMVLVNPYSRDFDYGAGMNANGFDLSGKGLPGFPIKLYLHRCAFPMFLIGKEAEGVSCAQLRIEFRSGKRMKGPEGTAGEWPGYVEKTRALKEVKVCGRWEFAEMVRRYIHSLPPIYITTETPSILLPCTGFTSYSDEEIDVLSNIDSDAKFMMMIKEHILGTISEVVRVMDHLPVGAPLAKGLQFREVEGKFGVFTLAENGLTVVCIPPWYLGNEEFDRIAEHEEIWAVLGGICDKYFIITNYIKWSFGDWRSATVSEPIDARLMDIRTGGEIPGLEAGASVAEGVMYWMQTARGAACSD